MLPLLDTLAQGGGNAAPGSCTGAVAGHLFDDNGRSFDRDGPLVAFDGGTPPAGAFVRGSIMVDATATDVGMLDPAPTLRIVTPAGTVDTDGDTNDRDIHATFDTATAVPGGGPLTVVLDGFDHSGNHSDVAMSTRTFTVDNTPPVVAITAPAMDGQYLRAPVTVQYTVTEANVMSTTALLDGMTPIAPGFQVALDGPHNVSVSVVDRAGNAASATRTFTIDNIAPVLSVTAPAAGSYVRGPVTLSWSVSDANPGTVATATLDGNPITSPHTTNDEAPHTLVVNATDAAGNVAATVTRTFTIDNTPPVITVNGVVDGGAYQAGVQIFYSATDANPGTTLSATANGVNHNSGQSLFAQVGYTLVVNATDAAGNTAIASRRFLVDSTAPGLSVRSQAPTGTYVKTPLTLVVDGTDNLQVSGVAGLAGSLAAPVTLAVTALSNGSPVAPTGGEVVNGDSSRTRTATFAGVADGSLAATFSMTDRSGNARTLPTINVTVDNTAPTNVALSSPESMGFVSANSAYWTSVARPTLSGSVTEANPGATVTLLNGATVVGAGTVTAGAWSATFSADVPESTGFDVTVRITDAAGNSGTSPIQRIARDITGPRITSIGRAFYSETNDTITYPTGNRPSHAHSGATTLLGGNASATPPATCPSIAKYAYLTAVAPQGDEPVANPLTFDWQIVDLSAPTTVGGAGVRPTSFQWRVTHVSSGVATSLYDITGTEAPLGTWAVQTNLRRDSTQPVPALGAIVGGVSQAREGRFNIELHAVDELGNATLVYSCMNYQPIGVPVKVSTPVAASGTGVDALTGYQLTANSTISQLLNGTHPGAGLMTVPVMNPTTDPVTLTFAPSSSGRTYSENWSFLRVPSAAALSANISCGDSTAPITSGVCSEQLTGAPPTPTEVHSTTAFGYVPQLAVRVWGPAGALTATESVALGCDPAVAECSRFRVDLPATTQFATYNVVVGLRELRDARFATTSSGYAEASTTYWSNVGTQGPEYRTMSYTGLPTLVPFATTGDGIDRACTFMSEAPLAGQPGEVTYTCTQTRRFQAIRYLASVGVGFTNVYLDAQSRVTASASFETLSMAQQRLAGATWSPTETTP
ncbi:MAG: Ig-like domain repeat protein [Myxococcales bacterium]|nr:Ig-like domain repeat protein [Myxococcales bacterium]